MTNQEAKEILNKPAICKEAERSVRDMKIKLAKYSYLLPNEIGRAHV